MPKQARRQFLTNAAFAGAAGLSGFGIWGKSLAAEPPPETTTVRLLKSPGICRAPQYVAEALLRAEGRRGQIHHWHRAGRRWRAHGSTACEAEPRPTHRRSC